MHAVVAEERFGGVLRRRSEFARDAHGRHLDQHAALDILSHDRWPVLDLPIALGVNQNWMHTLKPCWSKRPAKEESTDDEN